MKRKAVVHWSKFASKSFKCLALLGCACQAGFYSIPHCSIKEKPWSCARPHLCAAGWSLCRTDMGSKVWIKWQVSLRVSGVMHRDVWYKLLKKKRGGGVGQGERGREGEGMNQGNLNAIEFWLNVFGDLKELLLTFCVIMVWCLWHFFQGLSFRNPY